jgi:hypothetical protein
MKRRKTSAIVVEKSKFDAGVDGFADCIPWSNQSLTIADWTEDSPPKGAASVPD